MELLIGEVEKLIEDIAREEGLIHEISQSEIFPATINDPACVEQIRKAADSAQLPVRELDRPFRWSEDFGYYTEKYRGGYFGLGSGENTPPLHHPGFDFPDELIGSGVSLFYSIYASLHLGEEDGSTVQQSP
jgi:metal-dependent amidase/aminoacylase/carboxypeptidase family protein